VALASSLGLASSISPIAAAPQAEQYEVLDNVEGEFVNLNLPAVRPMFWWSPGELYAVNVHDSRVLYYNDVSGTPAAEFRVPWGPVSIGGWVVVARVLKNGEPVQVNSSLPTSFTIRSVPYTNFADAIQDPLLVSSTTTDARGEVRMTFTISGLQPDDEVTLAILGVGRPTPSHTPTSPDLDQFNRWSLPDTDPENRAITMTY